LLVRDSLLLADTIGESLLLDLPYQNPVACLSPVYELLPERPGAGGDKEPGGFTYQMVVGRGITGEMVANEVGMAVYGSQPAFQEALPMYPLEQRRFLSAYGLPDNTPVDEPDPQFERAAPVGPLQVRALFEPGSD
jgi:hypothetical protein